MINHLSPIFQLPVVIAHKTNKLLLLNNKTQQTEIVNIDDKIYIKTSKYLDIVNKLFKIYFEL